MRIIMSARFTIIFFLLKILKPAAMYISRRFVQEVIVSIQRQMKRCGVALALVWKIMASTMSLFIRIQHDSLFVNLFIASELNWKEKGIQLTQQTKFPYEEKTKLLITQGNSSFKLMIRYPWWVKDGELKITVNGKRFHLQIILLLT